MTARINVWVILAGMFGLFSEVSEKEKNNAIEEIVRQASPRRDFFVMITLSVAMAAFGILLDSTIILIGSMLIAPLLFPLLSLALGVTLADQQLIGRSVSTIGKSIMYAVGSSFIIALLFADTDALQVLTVTKAFSTGVPSLIYALVAGISGFAAAFALTKPTMNAMLPGVAISVSLVPPLAMVGVGLAALNTTIVANAFIIFVVNVAGIVLCAMLVFSMLQFAFKKTIVEKAVKADEKELTRENSK